MQLLMGLFWAPIMLLVFKIAPDFIAKHALYGELSALGYSKSAFPKQFIAKVASDTLTTAMLFTMRKSAFTRMAELQKGVHVTALQIHSLMSPDDVNASLATTATHLHEQMLLHGVKPTRQPR